MDPFFPDEACHHVADREQARLVNCRIRAFKSPFVPTTEVTLAMLEAEECDYPGYAPIVVAAWFNPIDAPGGGAQISAPAVQFEGDGTAGDPNVIGGYWIETADVVGPPAVPPQLVLVKPYTLEEQKILGPENSGKQVYPTIRYPNGLQ